MLKGVDIVRPNQVWQVDITYIKIRTGFIYLVCLIDVFSRKVIGFAISTFLDTESCINALVGALKHAKPEILNNDQGCQFTSSMWINKLKLNDILVSMDGKGRWADNVCIERFWRSLKYEMVYLHRFDTVSEAEDAIAKYIVFYNTKRPHQALGYMTPDEIFYGVNEKKSIEIDQSLITPFLGQQRGSQIFRQLLS